MSDFGARFSKSKKNVLSRLKIGEQKFSTAFNSLNIKKEYQRTITIGAGGTGSSTIRHELKYKPAFLAFSFKATTDTVAGISYSKAIMHCESGFINEFDRNNNTFNHGLMVTSDAENIYIQANGASGQVYNLYIFVLVDLAEETALDSSGVGNDFGMRFSQPGYSARTAPDFRMIYTSKYKALPILKTGITQVVATAITLNDGEENLTKVEVPFDTLGIPSGRYYPYISMLRGKTFSMTSSADFPTAGAYLPLTGLYAVNGIDAIIANYGLFLTNDRIVGYIYRSWFKGFSGPDSVNFAAMTVNMRYMLFDTNMNF